MINIKTYLSNAHADASLFLDNMVERLWSDLNPVLPNSQYGKFSLMYRAEQLVTLVSSPAHKKEVGTVTAARHLQYANYLADPVNMKRIICAKPSELDAVIAAVDNYLQPGDLHYVKDGKTVATAFGKLLLSDVFRYDLYRQSAHCVARYQALGFGEAACPYCNANAIQIVELDEGTDDSYEIMLCDIDHFYPKLLHPYLALSFYNHIPSCRACNHTTKGAVPFTVTSHIHPFDRCFDTHYTFKLNHGVLQTPHIEQVHLTASSGTSDALVTDLKLEERYRKSLTLSRARDLVVILSDYSHLLYGGTQDDVERGLLAIRLKDFGVRKKKEEIMAHPYAKFHRDIVKMFDVNQTLDYLES
ncbi:hypothetical protein [Pseudomonas sp. MWU13-3659]|uniref:hypothetical protein n=1 Tax=Pseudomonas sp. MWU13-3659 TaxID=2986964 RepID=UPI0020758B98|nr:hypothetical protein [Pseudomonas sp. MWU13-3659]